jgi:hypothetical protein
MALSAEIVARITATQTGGNDYGGPNFTPRVEHILQLSNGVSNDQADLLWVDERTVASGATDSLDVRGALTDAFGASLNAVEIVIANALPAIGPGGVILMADPDSGGLLGVTAGTGDLLQVVNASGAAATYQIVVIARSA